MEELLSLKWNNHRSTFIQILGTLREKQSYTDVTLACDGKFYSVHKLVLSTCSEYFSAMFDKTPCKNPVIVLKDIKSDDLDALLDYMYLGEVNVRQSDLASLIKAAECLRIKGLAVPDDEPPKKGPSTSRVGSSNAPERRADSPPAKRKRRDGSEDSRDDSRHSMAIAPQPPQAQSPPPSSSRPKTPPGGTQRHSPAPHPPRPSQSSPSEGGRAPSPSHPPTASPAERTTPQSRGGEGEQYDQPTPYVKVEMDDGGQGDPLGDSYDIPSDGYKEESDVGGDLSNDFPEFLQAAASGTLPGNSTSPSFSHPNFPGTSAFQPGEIPGWQGDGTIGLPPHLTFSTSENSSQNPGGRPPVASVRRTQPQPHLYSRSRPPLEESAGMPSSSSSSSSSSLHPFVTAPPPYIPRLSPASTSSSSSSSSSSPTPATSTTSSFSTSSGFAPSSIGFSSNSNSRLVLECPYCPKKFQGHGRHQLHERHVIVHTGERPFACPKCQYRANQMSNLRRHIRTVHVAQGQNSQTSSHVVSFHPGGVSTPYTFPQPPRPPDASSGAFPPAPPPPPPPQQHVHQTPDDPPPPHPVPQ